MQTDKCSGCGLKIEGYLGVMSLISGLIIEGSLKWNGLKMQGPLKRGILELLCEILYVLFKVSLCRAQQDTVTWEFDQIE